MHDLKLSSVLARVESLLAAARDNEGKPLNLHEVVVSTRSETRTVSIGKSGERVDIRSISKPVLSLLCGTLFEQSAAQKHGLNLDAAVWPFFEAEIALENVANLPNLRKLRVAHLLSSTLGHQEGIVFRKDIGDRPEETLLDYAFNTPLVHPPGTHFAYSNAGAFILSALITRVFQRTADDLAQSIIFSPLAIEQVNWRRFGHDCAGCTGLNLNASELNRIGRAILGDGPSSVILPPNAWRNSMLESFYPTPAMTDESRALPKRGYGHFLWKSRDSHCYTDGTDGQYLILCGDRETVVTVTGEQSDMKPIGEALRPILELAAKR
jgi:CubicO group peptidase (beta-lactamase class C family)